ncbi:MAG: hypothetical protein NVS1B11_34380 [Terriglobales bacterium]
MASIVYYVQWMLIEPSSSSAATGLLRHIPRTESTETAFMKLQDLRGTSKAGGPNPYDLAGIYQIWPKLLADAVVKFPKFLPNYVRFGLLAPNDIHSDYAHFEEGVCKKHHARFLAAFHKLTFLEQSNLKTRFNPDGCIAIR